MNYLTKWYFRIVQTQSARQNSVNRHLREGLMSMLMLLLVMSVLVLFSSSVSAASLRIAAASSLQFALNEIIDEYRQTNKAVNIQIVYGSSGNLYRQIVQGAPFDLFLSADGSLADKLFEAGVATDAGDAFGQGQLVLAVSPRAAEPVSADATLATLNAQSGSFRLAIANPAHAPYGKAAREYLQAINRWGSVKSALVYGEKVSQATQYVSSGAADAGIVSLSLAQALNLRHVLIDRRHYQPILHKMTRLSDTTDAADLYVHLSTSEAVAAVFRKYGYLTPRQ